MSEYFVSIDNSKKNIRLNSNHILIDGEINEIPKVNFMKNLIILNINYRFYKIPFIKKGNGTYIFLFNGRQYKTIVRTKLQEKANEFLIKQKNNNNVKEIVAPMPGLLLKINKKLGEKVNEGETVAVLEAMKMENEIKAPSSGIIKDIHSKEGTSIEKGVKILTIK